MAGCTGSGLRRLSPLLIALIMTGAVVAQAPSPAPVAAAAAKPVAPMADAGKMQRSHGKKMDKNIPAEKNPDSALIEYLGEYGDAADGLDPMGLADPDAPPTKSADDKG